MRNLSRLRALISWRIACAAVGVLALAGPAAAQNRAVAVHGVTAADYQTWFTKISNEGYRVSHLSAYTQGGTPHFAAVAIDDGRKLASQARHGLTAAQYQQEFTKLSGQGYQLVTVTGYPQGGATNYAAAWAKGVYSGAWESHHDMTPQQYQGHFDRLSKLGYRVVHLSGYPEGNGHRLAAIWVKDSGVAWTARHDLTAAQYQQEFDKRTKEGYRVLCVTGYQTGAGGGQALFAVVFVKDNREMVARHNLPAAQYQQEFNKWTGQGYLPAVVSGYTSQNQTYYAAVWLKAGASGKYPLPTSGQAVASLAAFDEAMQKFMKDQNITGGTLAVMKDGKILLSRGYGYQDSVKGKLLGPETPFRIASVSKPITLALLLKLIREGKISLTTKVVEYLGITPPAGQKMDPRWKDITVKHLIDHKGGFDRDAAFDPMFQSLKIAKALGKDGPATQADIIKYMAGQPLQFTPGSKSVYSNFGYCILGRVIEKATKQGYTTALRQQVLQPLGLSSIELGRTLPGNRNPKEPVYQDSGLTQNVMLPKSTVKVPWPDGGFDLEAMDAHGGLIASAPDLVRFLNAYWINGEPRKGGSQSWNFFGSLPGTWSMVVQRPDGINIAALFNHRTGTDSDYNIQKLLNAAADKTLKK